MHHYLDPTPFTGVVNVIQLISLLISSLYTFIARIGSEFELALFGYISQNHLMIPFIFWEVLSKY